MKKRYSIILLSFLLLILLKIFSVTYGFFETIINENMSLTSLTTQSEYLAVEYSDGTSIMNFAGDFLFPGDTAEKTFTVENTGEADTTYSILIDNVVNEFTRTQDLRYTLYIDEEEITTGAINNNEVQYLYYNREIAVGAKEEVKFIFEYSETEEIQNEDMNKNINFRFNITSKRNKVETTDDGSVTLISNETTLNNYRIYGNSIQDGTPTPETPIEIETVGEKTKNLFDYENIITNNSTVTKAQYNGRECIKWQQGGTTSSQKFLQGIFKENTQYRLSGEFTSNMTEAGYLKVFYTDSTYDIVYLDNYFSKVVGEFSKLDVTIGSTTKTIDYLSGTHNSGQIIYFDINTTSLTEGTSSTDYEPFGYKIPITVSSKNIANFEIVSNQYQVRTEKLSPNSFKVTKSNNNSTAYGQIETYLETGKTYTLFTKIESETAGGYVHAWKAYNAGSVYTSKISKYYTFTATQEQFILGLYPAQDANLSGLETTFTFMLVEGTYTSNNYPEYEPFVEPTTYNIYLDEPLRKVGNVYDYIDFKDQTLYREIGEYTFTGSENSAGGVDTNTNTFGMTVLIPNSARRETEARKGLNNYLPQGSVSGFQTSGQFAFWNAANHPYVYLYFDKSYFPNYEEYSETVAKTILKEWYDAGSPMKLQYVYQKSEVTPFELPEIKLHEYTNVITIDTETSPSTFEVEVTK